MRTETTTTDQVKAFLQKHLIITVDQLADMCSCSRNTIFLKLRSINHMTSYSHNNRFLALTEHIEFDEDGLCQLEEACFSKWGNVKETILALVKRSEQGLITGQINSRLQIRANRQLGELVKSGKLLRKRKGRHQYYFSADPKVHERQLKNARRAWKERDRKVARVPDELVIRILVTIIQEQETEPEALQKILSGKDIDLPLQTLEQVIAHYNLKKT